MIDGWIKLWRKLLGSSVFQHEGLLKLWILCLLKANHEEKEIILPGLLKPIKVKPGQFVTGRDSLHFQYHQGRITKRYSRKLTPVPRTLFRWLENLSNLQNLSIKTTNKYSIVTITNWHEHQALAQKVSSSATGKRPQTRSIKNIYSCEFFSIDEKHHGKYQQAYPTVDLMAEYKRMAAWLESNPKKRKTPRGYPRFVNNWLSEAYDKKKDSSDWRDKLKPL